MTLIRVVYDPDGKREEYEVDAEGLAAWQSAQATGQRFTDMEGSSGGSEVTGYGYTIRRIDIYDAVTGWPTP